MHEPRDEMAIAQTMQPLHPDWRDGRAFVPNSRVGELRWGSTATPGWGRRPRSCVRLAVSYYTPSLEDAVEPLNPYRLALPAGQIHSLPLEATPPVPELEHATGEDDQAHSCKPEAETPERLDRRRLAGVEQQPFFEHRDDSEPIRDDRHCQ